MGRTRAILERQNLIQQCGRLSRTFSQHLRGLLPSLVVALVTIGCLMPALASAQSDGPAQLPQRNMPSAMSNTPAPGSIISVNAGDDLQLALNNAHCGDTIELQAGATFTGKFVVPAKGCDINHWIIVRTSAPNSALPAEGQRVTPCYAGVASLPGRPQYACTNPQKVLAKVQTQVVGNGPLQLAASANFYRFTGLEITRPVGAPEKAQLITARGAVNHLVVDRSWLHGQRQDETSVGVNLNQMTYVAVVDSYFNDFHCISVTGLCTDAHAIGGGLGDIAGGPYKIQNNFLEASGQGILFGGGTATTTPSDIQIIGNHFFKPWQWMPGNPNFVGGANGNPFVVKNHLELKNAVRVLIDSNLMENNWGGFSQSGYSILLTPKNQHEGTRNVCSICQVTDVTIRYTHISHVASGLQLATSLSGNGTTGAPAKAGTRWSIHDVVMDDLNMKYNGGGNAFLIINNWPANPLNTVTISHVTAFPDPNGHMLITGNKTTNPPMYGLVFRNNLVLTGRYPVWNSGWGWSSCAYKDVPLTTVNRCFSTYTFSNNALIAPPPAFPPSTWPAGNTFPATTDVVAFTDYNNAVGGNYQLLPASPYKNKGTDGKDLGADMAGLNQALTNIE